MASNRTLIAIMIVLCAGPAYSQAVERIDIERHRIRLADRYAGLVNDIPEILRADSTSRAMIVRNSGFRIQITSTKDVREAESLRRQFDEWVLSELESSNAHSYVIFRQPFYRVHVGDFRNRAAAQEFSNRVKERFPDAWVVIDQIVAERVR